MSPPEVHRLVMSQSTFHLLPRIFTGTTIQPLKVFFSSLLGVTTDVQSSHV
jgi:hypothetical protein